MTNRQSLAIRQMQSIILIRRIAVCLMVLNHVAAYLKTQTDAKGQTITFNYDGLNRVTSKTCSTGDPIVTYTYDNLSIPNGRGRAASGELTWGTLMN